MKDRAARRHKTFVPTSIQSSRGELRAHILNLSMTGALLHAEPAPGRGQRVIVMLGGRRVAAMVAWVEGARFGVAFAHPLGESEVADLLG